MYILEKSLRTEHKGHPSRSSACAKFARILAKRQLRCFFFALIRRQPLYYSRLGIGILTSDDGN